MTPALGGDEMTIPQQPGPRRLGPLHTGTLPTAEQQFRPGGEFTLGAEEESLLVRRNGHLRSGGAERLATELARHPSAAGVVKPEIFANQIELNSVVCESAAQLHGSLAGLRADVRRAGAWLLATGVHPAARFGQVRTVRSARYDAIHAELGGLLRTPTSSLEVHVGFPDAETAMTAYAGLRHQLPILRALEASSPLWYGQDSGLVCARAAIMWSYPRVGIPPAVHDYAEYVDRATQAMAAAEVPDHSFLWWDMRVQPQLGTLEVRVMDTQTSLEQAAGLAALVKGSPGPPSSGPCSRTCRRRCWPRTTSAPPALASTPASSTATARCARCGSSQGKPSPGPARHSAATAWMPPWTPSPTSCGNRARPPASAVSSATRASLPC